MAARPVVLFVLGGPGAGKGTQCAKICETYDGWAHISAGDCLRAEKNNPDSKDGEQIRQIIKEGKLVPSEITVKLLQKAMTDQATTGKTCFLIDGFPRNMENVTVWEDNVGAAADLKGVLFFDASEEEMTSRLLGRNEGRDDDNIVTIKKRFETFTNESMPIVTLYEERNQIFRVDGMKSPEEVFAATQRVINPITPLPVAPVSEVIISGSQVAGFTPAQYVETGDRVVQSSMYSWGGKQYATMEELTAAMNAAPHHATQMVPMPAGVQQVCAAPTNLELMTPVASQEEPSVAPEGEKLTMVRDVKVVKKGCC